MRVISMFQLRQLKISKSIAGLLKKLAVKKRAVTYYGAILGSGSGLHSRKL